MERFGWFLRKRWSRHHALHWPTYTKEYNHWFCIRLTMNYRHWVLTFLLLFNMTLPFWKSFSFHFSDHLFLCCSILNSNMITSTWNSFSNRMNVVKRHCKTSQNSSHPLLMFVLLISSNKWCHFLDDDVMKKLAFVS